MSIVKLIIILRFVLAIFFALSAFCILHSYLTERDRLVKSGEKIFPFIEDARNLLFWLFWLSPYIISLLDFMILSDLTGHSYLIATINGVCNVVAAYFVAEIKSSAWPLPSWFYCIIAALYVLSSASPLFFLPS